MKTILVILGMVLITITGLVKTRLVNWRSTDSSTQAAYSVPIVDVEMGVPIYCKGQGDTWDPAWAEDDNLYSPNNDGHGYGSKDQNVIFNKISGNDPRYLSGELQNSMDKYGAVTAGVAADGRNWKTGGCISIDGTLYMSIGMDWYVDKNYGGRQSRINASIVKSHDHGLTWARSMSDNLNSPMFVSMRFSTLYFTYYGKDYSAATVDNADKYIYATANNGFWDNGDNFILGRVSKSKIGNFNSADWTFYKSGDGMVDSAWTPDAKEAAWIINAPRQCGEAGITYIPDLHRYVMIPWYYPAENGHSDNTKTTVFVFYESPKPWGPWTRVKEITSSPQGWYIPRVLSKFQIKEGENVNAFIAVSGNYQDSAYYKYTMVPVKFKTASTRK
jgi:hypothetical protein